MPINVAQPLRPDRRLPQELSEAIGEILEGAGLGSAEIDALCDGITAAFIGDDDRTGSSAAASGPELIVDLRGIILAFAGRARTPRTRSASSSIRPQSRLFKPPLPMSTAPLRCSCARATYNWSAAAATASSARTAWARPRC